MEDDPEVMNCDYDWGITPSIVLIKEEPEEPGLENISDSHAEPLPTPLQRSRLKPRIIIQDIADAVYQDASGCSNCYARVGDGGGKRLNEVLCRRRACQDGQTLQVTVIEALDVIFEVTKKSSISKVLLDEVNYILCWRCTSLLTQLYKLFMKFVEITQVPSFLQSIVIQNKPLRVYKSIIKNEFVYEDDSTQLPFEVELDEGNAPPPQVSKYVFHDDGESAKGDDDEWNGDLDDVDNDSSEDYKMYSSTKRRKLKRAHTKSEPETPVKRKRGRPPGKKKYPCQECKQIFTKPSKLERHLKVHFVKKYSCTHEGCPAGYKFKFLLNRHMDSHSGSGSGKTWRLKRGCRGPRRPSQIEVTTVGDRDENSCYVCKDCGLVFTKPSRLLRHEVVHATKSFSCKECDIGYKSAALLTRHNTNIHREKKKSGKSGCEDNDAKYSDGEEVPKKRIKHTNGVRRYDCSECPAKYVRSDHLRRHITVRSERNHICSICQAGFKTPLHLERHFLRFHADSTEAEKVVAVRERRIRTPVKPSSKSYPCMEDNCTAVYSRANHLNRHRKEKHSLESLREPYEPTPCPVCSIIIGTKSKMDIHLNKKHRPSIVVNTFECDECGTKHRDKTNLENHKFTHRDEKPYMCDICGFTTKRSYQLTSHVSLVHVANRPFICTTCGMSFKVKSHLRYHEIKHLSSEYRPYKCTFEGCTKSYRYKRHLRSHLDLHAGHKFPCELCGRVFTRQDNLKVHRNTVHFGKPGRGQRARVLRGASSSGRTRRPRELKNLDLVYEDDSDEEISEPEENDPVMVVQENLNQNQPQPQPLHPYPQRHHILTNPGHIPQPIFPGQNIFLPNPYGEFYQ